MNKIALFAFFLGVLMATIAYMAEINDWSGLQEYMTAGFAGYVLIISATAYYCTNVLFQWSQEVEVWQG